jgi:hypothetical protein
MSGSLMSQKPNFVVGLKIDSITARGEGTPEGVNEDIIVDGIQYPDQVTEIMVGSTSDASIASACINGMDDTTMTKLKKKQGSKTGETLNIEATLYTFKDSAYSKIKSVKIEGATPEHCSSNTSNFMINNKVTAETFNDKFQNCDNLTLDVKNAKVS